MRAVLLVGPTPPPIGGTAAHVRELARALRARDVTVDVVDPRRDGPAGDGRKRLLWQLARARARDAIVHVHTNGHNRGSWRLAAIAGASARTALVTLHSGLAPSYVRAHPRLVRATLTQYRRVIAVNPEIAAALVEAGLDPARLQVTPAFTPSSLAFRLAPPGFAALRRQHPLLFACALAEGAEYGADVLLDAWVHVRARLPHAALLVYGPGTRDAGLAAEVARRGLRGGVHLLGELGRERALAVVAGCDLFVRPSRADGDAISVREAIALGRPVVATAVGQRPPEALLCPPGDPLALAEKIFHAVGNRSSPPAPRSTSTPDCLPELLAIYARYGLAQLAATNGTALATDPA
jgi:glycosyltransferase involved in cell wall biosynthesis